MRSLLLTAAGLALVGLGVVSVTPAYAGMTPEQLSAEGWPAATGQTPATAQVPQTENGAVAGRFVGGPADPNNGLAQDRITGAQVSGSPQ